MPVLHRITNAFAYYRMTLRLLGEHAEDTINRYLWLRLIMGLWIVVAVAFALVGMINYQHARIYDWLPAFVIFGCLYLVWAILATFLHIRNRRQQELRPYQFGIIQPDEIDYDEESENEE